MRWGRGTKSEGRGGKSEWGAYGTSSRRSYRRSHSSHHTSGLQRCTCRNCRRTYLGKLHEKRENGGEGEIKKFKKKEGWGGGVEGTDSDYKLSKREWQFMFATSIMLPMLVPNDQSNYKSISVILGDNIKTGEYWEWSAPDWQWQIKRTQ